MELTDNERDTLRALVEAARKAAPGDSMLAALEAKLAVGGGPGFAKYAELLEPARRSDPDILSRIRAAVDTASPIAIRYTARTTGETTERVVRPFNVHFYDGREYLEAYCELRKEDRVFAVGNIEALLEDDTPERSED